MKSWNRRQVLAAAAALGIAPRGVFGASERMLSKKIPSSDEALPVVGLGTYNVSGTPEEIATRKNIVAQLVDAGGSLIDTSPMYNRSEAVVGDVIDAGINREDLFLATKVWTDGQKAGAVQMQRSAKLMRTQVIDLMQVHNLRDTATHMETIREWQDDGRIRYSGLTHYTAGAHESLAAEMAKFAPQFIQINYSLSEREAEDRVLPMAQDLGIAVLINRPFQAGRLFRAVAGSELPEFAKEFASSWGQFFLKFIISHPAVTCVIPATSKPHHMIDNLGAGFGTMPDRATRQRMIEYFSKL